MPRIRIAGGPVHVGVHTVDERGRADRRAGAAARLQLHRPSAARTRGSYLFLFIAALGARDRAHHRGRRPAQLARLGLRRARAAARRGPDPADDAAAGELAPLAADLRARLRDLEDEYRRSQGPEAPLERRAPARAAATRSCAATRSSSSPTASPTSTSVAADGSVVVRRPASGLVTAVEPVMRACSGTWIAHGSGNADRERRRRARPRRACRPGDDDYTLRRIWLTAEEEQGYYYGFANEGLWPLCHVAHVRPVFRESDWEALPRGQPALRRRRGRRGAQRGSDRAGAGLPLRAAAGDDPRAPAARRPSSPSGTSPGRTRSRSASARGGARSSRACWAAPSSASTPASTARTSSRRSTATSRRASSTSTRRSRSSDAETLVESYPISIEWPSRRDRGAAGRRSSRVPAARSSRGWACPPDSCLARRRRPLRLHQGHPRAAARGRAPAREAPGMDRPLRLRAGRRADAQRRSRNTARSRSASSACAERINERFGGAGYRPVHPAGAAPRARRRSTSCSAPPTSAW